MLSDYEIVGEIARGGMGVVLDGYDPAFERSVAIKIIRPDRGDLPDVQRRFVAEAALMGSLQHPGVPPVHRRGSTEEGHPFYVMKLIEGETLASLLSSRSSPAEQCSRFVDVLISVCETMGYAHSQQILHRDLKPANIMVGSFGEVQVMDWGMAKRLTRQSPGARSDHGTQAVASAAPTTEVETVLVADAEADTGAELTHEGDILGTPAFMSPEQARGEVDALGPATDIYSLGAILYVVLTGQPPVSGSVPEILAQLRSGAVVSPAAINPQAPPPLVAICLKALAHDPQQRYADALAMAEDLRAWITDRPVSVYDEPRLERLWRWTRQNRSRATAIGVATGLSLLGLIAFAGLQQYNNSVLSEANRREVTAREDAERNFGLANEAVNDMLAEVGVEDLASVPRMDESRKRLLRRAVVFFEKLLEQRTRQDVELNRASAERKLSQIYSVLGENSAATRHLEAAIADLEELHARAGGAATRQLAMALSQRGWARRRAGELENAESDLRRAIDLVGEPQSVDAAQLAMRCLSELGLVLGGSSRATEAEETLRQAIDTARPYQPDGTPIVIVQQLANAHNNLGNLYARTARNQDAMTEHSAAIAYRETLVQANAADPDLVHELATSLGNVALLAARSGEIGRALELNGQAIDHEGSLIENFPSRHEYVVQKARLIMNRATLHAAAGDPNAAATAYADALTLLEAMHRRVPEDADVAKFLSAALVDRGWDLAGAGDWSAADERFSRVMELGVAPLADRAAIGSALCAAKQAQHQAAFDRIRNIDQPETIAALKRSYGQHVDVDLAGILSVAAKAAAHDSDLGAEAEVVARRNLDYAFELLGRASADGLLQVPAIVNAVQSDPDFEYLRADDRFGSILQK